MGLFEHFPYTNFHELNIGWILDKLRDKTEALTKYGGGRSLGWTGYSHYKRETATVIEIPDAASGPVNLVSLKIPPKVIGIVTWGLTFAGVANESGYRMGYVNTQEGAGSELLLGLPDKRAPIGGLESTMLSGAGTLASGDDGVTVYLKAEQFSGSPKNVINYFVKFTVLSGEIPDGWDW